MDAPSEDIAFLASSPNRVGVLEALAEGPCDRHDLQAELDISQPTASRILRALSDREWIVRHGDEYELTRVGKLTVEAFTDLRERLAAIHHLGGVASMLPEEGFDFDFARLRTADLVRTTEGDSGLARTHENAQLASADHVRILTSFAPREGVETTWRQVTMKGQRFELIIEASTLSIIQADEDLARWTREILASDRAEIYRYDEEIAYPMLITDDTVHLALPKDDETGGAWVSTDDGVVIDWAESAFENYRDQAVKLMEGDFSALGGTTR